MFLYLRGALEREIHLFTTVGCLVVGVLITPTAFTKDALCAYRHPINPVDMNKSPLPVKEHILDREGLVCFTILLCYHFLSWLLCRVVASHHYGEVNFIH